MTGNLEDDEIYFFIEEKRNEQTTKKTHLNVLRRWCKCVRGTRAIEKNRLGEFFVNFWSVPSIFFNWKFTWRPRSSFSCKPYNTVFSHYSIFVCKCEIKLHDALLDSIDKFEILSFALLRDQAIFFSQWNFVVRVTDWLHEESVQIIFTKISGHKSQ